MNTVHLNEDSRIVLVSMVQTFLNVRKLIEPGYYLANITLETRPVIVGDVESMTSLSLDAKLAQPVSVLKIDERARTIRRIIERTGIYSVGQVVRLTESRLRKYRNVGNKTISGIKKVIECEGLTLGMLVPVGPLEKAFYQRLRISEPHFPLKVVMNLISFGIQTYGDIRSLDDVKKLEVTQLLGQMSREDSNYPSGFNDWLNTYPTGESRFQRLYEFAETFGMQTQAYSFP